MKEEAKKAHEIPKGGGTPLEDIPNVASKMSRLTRNSPLVGQLHSLLFGGKAKVRWSGGVGWGTVGLGWVC